MKILITILCLTTSIWAFSQDQVSVWPNSKNLAQNQKYQDFYNQAQEIADDLNLNGDKYSLIYKTKGGSSHQSLVKRNIDGQIMGIWSAPNHATYLLGEIFAFNLARLFNRGEWAAPAVRMTLTGPALVKVKAAMNVKAHTARLCNRDTILAYMDKNKEFITGAYMPFNKGIYPEKVRELVDTTHQKRLVKNHFLVKMLHHSEALPTGEKIYFNPKAKTSALSYEQKEDFKFETTDSLLAKELSFMMLIDALNSQRDRFGPNGSNMEVFVNENDQSFFLSLIDNGGISDSAYTSSLKFFIGEYGPGISRFEKDIFDKVLALDDFLSGEKLNFLNYQSIDELKVALGYETDYSTNFNIEKPASCNSNHSWLFHGLKTRWDKRFFAFEKAIKKVANYLRTYETNEDAFF